MKIRILSTVLMGAVALAGCREEIIVPVDPPLARNDLVRTTVDAPVIVDVLANDHDPNGEALMLTALGVPSSGSIVQNPDSTVTFTPAIGFTGGASFTYTIRDASGHEAQAAAHITVGDSTRLVYRSDVDEFQVNQLYIADSAHPDVKFPLSGVLPLADGVTRGTTSNIVPYGLSPDRSKIAYYTSDVRGVSRLNLFVVDLARPGVATKLTDIPDGRAINAGFAPGFSHDNSKVFFVATLNDPDHVELYMIDLDDPTQRVVFNRPLAEGENVSAYMVAADGANVIYTVNSVLPDGPDEGTEPDGPFETIYTATIDSPGTGVKLNGTAPASGTLQNIGLTLSLSPDGRSIGWVAAENGDTTRRIYMADYVARTSPVALGRTPVGLGASDFQWSLDGTAIIYRATEDTPLASELYYARVDQPGQSTKLGPLLLNDNGNPIPVQQYMLGPDGTYALYVRPDLDDAVSELFKVDIADPGVSVRLNAPLLEDQNFRDFRVTPAVPRHVLYTQDALDEEGLRIGMEIMWVDVDAPGVVTKMGDNLTFHPEVAPSALYSFDPTGTQVLYRADPEERSAFSLQMVQVSAPTTVTRLTTERVPGASVKNAEFLP